MKTDLLGFIEKILKFLYLIALNRIICDVCYVWHRQKADTALMFDGTKVFLDAYNRLLKKKADIFRNNYRRGDFFNNGSKGIDCRKLPVTVWEHGDKITKYLIKVSTQI